MPHAPTQMHAAGSAAPAAILLIFLLAFAARAGLGVVRASRSSEPAALEYPDEQQYWMMAASVRAGNGLRDELGFRATRMPLYPLFLSLFPHDGGGQTWVRALQWLIGSAAAVFSFLLANRLFGKGAALLAGVLVALDPFLAYFSSLLLTETLCITLLCALWWELVRCVDSVEEPIAEQGATSRLNWVSITILSIALVYVRESTIGLVIASLVLATWISFKRSTDDRGRTLARGTASMAAVILSLVPWGVRNRQVTGEWCWLTTRGGISLYDGVGPQATGASDLGDVKAMPTVSELREGDWNRYFLGEALTAIRDNPARIVRLAVTKIRRMWNPFPNVQTHQSKLERWVSFWWNVGVFSLSGLGVAALLYKKRRHGLLVVAFLLLPAIYFTALHSIFVGSVRYRLTAVPALEVLAAIGAVSLLVRCSRIVKEWNASVDRGHA